MLWTVDVVREAKAARVSELREIAMKIDLRNPKVNNFLLSFHTAPTSFAMDMSVKRGAKKNFYLY